MHIVPLPHAHGIMTMADSTWYMTMPGRIMKLYYIFNQTKPSKGKALDKFWSIAYFYHLPLCAHITIMASISSVIIYSVTKKADKSP